MDPDGMLRWEKKQNGGIYSTVLRTPYSVVRDLMLVNWLSMFVCWFWFWLIALINQVKVIDYM